MAQRPRRKERAPQRQSEDGVEAKRARARRSRLAAILGVDRRPACTGKGDTPSVSPRFLSLLVTCASTVGWAVAKRGAVSPGFSRTYLRHWAAIRKRRLLVARQGRQLVPTSLSHHSRRRSDRQPSSP